VFFFTTFLYGQNHRDSSLSILRQKISFDIGGHYNYHFTPIESKIGNGLPTQSYSGYTDSKYIPSFAIQSGIWYDLYLTNKLILKTGMVYINRKIQREGNTDTIQKYLLNFDNPIKSDYISDHRFEIPLTFGYKLNKLIFYFGAKFPVFKIRKQNKIFISETSREISSHYFDNPFANLNFTFRCSRELAIKKQLVNIYIAIDNRYWNGWKNYDFQIGLEFPFFSF